MRQVGQIIPVKADRHALPPRICQRIEDACPAALALSWKDLRLYFSLGE